MRILVLSDTHRHLEPMRRAVAQAGAVDYIFHLGDHLADAAQMANYSDVPVLSVKGNCDYAGEAQREVYLEGQKMILTHGHQFAVKYSLNRLGYYAQEQQADAVLFGHTHVPCMEYVQGRLLYNPGSLGEPRGRKATFGLLMVTKEGIYPKTVELL